MLADFSSEEIFKISSDSFLSMATEERIEIIKAAHMRANNRIKEIVKRESHNYK